MERTVQVDTALLVDAETINKTTACGRNFSCLETGTCSNCNVYACLDDTLLVQCVEREHCDYREIIDGRETCQCPVRNKLFAKFGK